MRDRTALDAFLKETGFARLGGEGGGVLLEPSASETKEVRRSEKSVVATISTKARDRHGDVIDPAGVRLDRFRKNPVVLYAHDYQGLPVAKSLWERVRAVDAPGRGAGGVELVAKPQFHCNTELSREVWALVEKGVLSAWSIGFIPERWKPGPEGKGFVVEAWDLLEYSCVPVPANFQALTHELKERRISAPALVKSLAPLGFEAPDLVEHEVRRRKDEGGRMKDEGDPEPSSSFSLQPSSLDVEAAVGRAFERVIRRARGAD
jgi:HK97 family phage prohead protease